LPGRIKTKDGETKLGALFRVEEWPVPPDDDSLVLRPFDKEALASFVLQDGKIEVRYDMKRSLAKDGTNSDLSCRRNTRGRDTRVKMDQRNTDENTRGKMERWFQQVRNLRRLEVLYYQQGQQRKNTNIVDIR